MTPEERVELELALLEVEVELLAELVDRAIVPPNARRQPSPGELRAGVMFAELDRIVEEAAQLIARHTDTVRTGVLDGIAEALSGAMAEANPYAALERLAALADPSNPDALPGVRQLVDDAAAAIERDLIETARQGGAQVLDEAVRQGLPDALRPNPAAAVDDNVRAAARAAAQRVASHPVTRLLGVAVEAGQRAAQRPDAAGYDVVEGALEAAEAAPPDGTIDQARQAANAAHGLGRTNVARTGPTPKEVYASELLDRNTCTPCSHVDGRTYVDLEAALVDYPGAGGYVDCEGGARCRGTLVIVWHTESSPTLDGPGDGRRGGDGHTPDRTPRGPSTGGPTGAPDPGVSPTPSAGAMALDDAGRVAPATTIADPVPEPAEPTVPPEADPQLEQVTTAELNRQLRDPAVDFDTRVRIADELDRRDLGTSGYRNPDADPGWGDFEVEDAGGDVVDYGELEALEAARFEDEARNAGLTTKPGRRIDHVRETWDVEVYRASVDAEDVTAGNLIRRDRLEDFRAKYGANTDVLFTGPARVGYHYASEELRAYWDTKPRLTFAEFAVSSGINDAKTVARAKAAALARDEARLRAEEDVAKRAERKRQAEAERRRRDHNRNSAGRQLERAQRRAAAERKRAERITRDLGRTETPKAAPAPAPAPPAPTPSTFDPKALADALSPARKRTKAAILKDLEATPAGRDLTASIKAFTETRGGVANLRNNITKLRAGEASPAVAARTRAFLDAMNTYPADEVPVLFRGIAVRVEEDTAAWWDAFEAQFTPGSTFDLNASSFTSNERKAAEFERMIGGTRKASSNYTAVRFVLEGDTRALPVETLSKFKSEREWITGGEFEVTEFTPASKAQPYARVVIRQRRGLTP